MPLSELRVLHLESGVLIENLADLGAPQLIETDLVIIGGGPAGITIARELSNTPINVLVLESGILAENPTFDELNEVESVGEPKTKSQQERRALFHGANARAWSSASQGYGIRCRVFGGSTQAWAGKSAAFSEIDFAERSWVPFSGWPFGLDVLAPYLDRAADTLNLGPNCYDERLWNLMGRTPPQPAFDPAVLKSFFWQFSRSRIDSLDIMRFGREFLGMKAPNVKVLINATVTHLNTNANGSVFTDLEVSTIDGARTQIRAKAAVLAASAIENARLLLVSNRLVSNGVGNQNDVVGRFLMDHPGARIGSFKAEDCDVVINRFGFYGVRSKDQYHMYMHGLVPSAEIQAHERLMHCALYMLGEHAIDDPWDAIKRLLQRKYGSATSDLLAVAKSPGLLAKGLAMRLLSSNSVPHWAKDAVVNTAIRFNPNLVVREFQNRGVPHKLNALAVDAITEQAPDPESRITLSAKTDKLGVPMARINWTVDEQARRSLLRIAQLLMQELSKAGLPTPTLEEWVREARTQNAPIIDMGHSAGTTRMSENPRRGVVNSECEVHGVSNLYVAGGSVFPTTGHANPTLMIVALAIKLSDTIKTRLTP
jgi:choline dehydrogenase-like flavoprotein